MKILRFAFVFIMAAGCITHPLFAKIALPEVDMEELALLPEEEKSPIESFINLDWKDIRKCSLPKSHAQITIPRECLILTEDAPQLLVSLGHPLNENIEACIFDQNTDQIFFLEWIEEGHVAMDDWNALNSAQLLAAVNELAAKEKHPNNAKPALQSLAWIAEPALEKGKQTIHWAIDAQFDDGERLVKSVAIKLARNGYEKISCIVENPEHFSDRLERIIDRISFKPGHGYADFDPNDKMAKYQVAALVTASCCGKFVKTGFLASIMDLFGQINFTYICIAAGVLFAAKKEFSKRSKS